ncbi:MAG: hypothetical protein JW838_10120 [Spirochaetes bacterium]|nr:hypothetical protein [Spirochaetota bacterium]
MERTVHKSYSFEEAEEWDIEQCVAMTPEKRMEIARILKERVYGKNPPGMKKTRVFKKLKMQ